MRNVSRDQDVARLAEQPIAEPLRRIAGLQIASRREFCKRIARGPERLRRLPRSEFPAVPDDGRPRAARRSFGRQPIDLRASRPRQRPQRVDRFIDRFAVVNQEEVHEVDPGIKFEV
jgi:hypothetical protein